jgi:coatomer subunit zeta
VRHFLHPPDPLLTCLVPRRIIVDTDAAAISSRVSKARPDTTEIVINEQTIMSAYQTVKEKMQQRMGQLPA